MDSIFPMATRKTLAQVNAANRRKWSRDQGAFEVGEAESPERKAHGTRDFRLVLTGGGKEEESGSLHQNMSKEEAEKEAEKLNRIQRTMTVGGKEVPAKYVVKP